MSLPTRYNLLEQFPAEYYIETGIYRGDSIAAAIEAGHYNTIIGIDNSPDCIHFVKHRFDLFRNPGSQIFLYEGDSSKILYEICKDIKGKITFFLDAHWMMLEDEVKPEVPFPLEGELSQITHLKRNDHTIIIDDMLIMQPEITGFSNAEIIYILREINCDYEIKYFANPIIKNLLAAWVK